MSETPTNANADIALYRLQKLIERGYASKVVLSPTGALHSIELDHPSCTKKRYVPKLALWSDGVLATNGLLWPDQYVASERVAPPTWQKCIAAEDGATFSGFAASIALPGFVDLHVRPMWRNVQRAAFRLMFGTSLVMSIALPTKLAASAIGITP